MLAGLDNCLWDISPIFLLIWLFGGGLLLLFGARSFAHKAEVKYGKCLAANILLIVLQLFLYGYSDAVGFSLSRDADLPFSLILDMLILALAVIVGVGIVRVMLNITVREGVVTVIPLLAVYFLAAMFLSANIGRREPCYRAVCKTRLKGLGTAIELYTQAENTYPPSPKELIDGGYASEKNFKCPSDTQDREVSYFYLPQLETDEGATFVMCDLKGNHKDCRNVLHKAGHVAEYSEEEFQKELAKPYNARFAESLKKAEGP